MIVGNMDNTRAADEPSLPLVRTLGAPARLFRALWHSLLRGTGRPLAAPEPDPEPMVPQSEAYERARYAYSQGKDYGYRLAVDALAKAIEDAKQRNLDFSKTDAFNRRSTTRGTQ